MLKKHLLVVSFVFLLILFFKDVLFEDKTLQDGFGDSSKVDSLLPKRMSPLNLSNLSLPQGRNANDFEEVEDEEGSSKENVDEDNAGELSLEHEEFLDGGEELVVVPDKKIFLKSDETYREYYSHEDQPWILRSRKVEVDLSVLSEKPFVFNPFRDVNLVVYPSKVKQRKSEGATILTGIMRNDLGEKIGRVSVVVVDKAGQKGYAGRFLLDNGMSFLLEGGDAEKEVAIKEFRNVKFKE